MVARGDGASVIIGVEGDEKGPKKKVSCCECVSLSLAPSSIAAARRETACSSAEGKGRSDQEES